MKNWKVVGMTNREGMRRSQLKRDFNLDIEEFDRMLAEQNNRCKICGEQIFEGQHIGSNFMAYVDHNHRTGRVRGILCRLCNIGLGCFKDSTSLLKKVIIYLGDDED